VSKTYKNDFLVGAHLRVAGRKKQRQINFQEGWDIVDRYRGVIIKACSKYVRPPLFELEDLVVGAQYFVVRLLSSMPRNEGALRQQIYLKAQDYCKQLFRKTIGHDYEKIVGDISLDNETYLKGEEINWHEKVAAPEPPPPPTDPRIPLLERALEEMSVSDRTILEKVAQGIPYTQIYRDIFGKNNKDAYKYVERRIKKVRQRIEDLSKVKEQKRLTENDFHNYLIDRKIRPPAYNPEALINWMNEDKSRWSKYFSVKEAIDAQRKDKARKRAKYYRMLKKQKKEQTKNAKNKGN